jgi:hypothetical protein
MIGLAFGPMEGQEDHSTSVRDIWRLVLAVLGVLAIIQELRKPKDERTWNGNVAGFVPYDFRIPTLGRFKDVYWNPEGRIVGSKVFGVGWAVNVGAVVGKMGLGSDDPTPEDDDPQDYVVG